MFAHFAKKYKPIWTILKENFIRSFFTAVERVVNEIEELSLFLDHGVDGAVVDSCDFTHSIDGDGATGCDFLQVVMPTSILEYYFSFGSDSPFVREDHTSGDGTTCGISKNSDEAKGACDIL